MCLCDRKEFGEYSNLFKLQNENAFVHSADQVLGCLAFLLAWNNIYMNGIDSLRSNLFRRQVTKFYELPRFPLKNSVIFFPSNTPQPIPSIVSQIFLKFLTFDVI